MISGGVVEECLNCGDEEYDINELEVSNPPHLEGGNDNTT